MEIETTQADMTDIQQWADLNAVFAKGKLQVWYLRPECFRDYGSFSDKLPNPYCMSETHILLGSVAPCPNGEYDIEELDEVWRKLQGEFWSPNGEARTMIRALGLAHTSMSIGDCFRFPNGDVFRVADEGFTKLGVHVFETRTFTRVKKVT